MKNALLLIAISLLGAGAHAKVPMFAATCPGSIEVHAKAGGPVYIKGKRASVKQFNDNYYEAKGAGITLSIAVGPDGAPSLSYTGPKRANGVCALTSSASDALPVAAGNPSQRKAVDACVAELAQRVSVPKASITIKDVVSADAGTGVDMTIPSVNTPWSCMYSHDKVQGLKARE